MKAHDVRALRVCADCSGLVHKDDVILPEHTCAPCAFKASRYEIRAFMKSHAESEWAKLPLSLIGVRDMRILVAALAPSPSGGAPPPTRPGGDA